MNTFHPMLALLLWLFMGAAGAVEQSPNVYPGQELDLDKGEQVYRSACARCHDKGQDHAPKLSNPKAWKQSSIRSFSTMEEHVKNGFLMMPAEGKHSTLTDEDLANAVYYITNRLQRRP